MSVNTPVVDRVPTYPGRVRLDPVNGQANTYDMTRADQPVTAGTPINKALLDQKAYTLTKSVTLYVSPGGNDTTGNGTSTAPYKTINKALSTIPKFLGGFTATVNVAAGIYNENVTIQHFGNGNLVITGVDGAAVTVNGVMVDNVKSLEINNIALNISGGFFHIVSSGVRVASPVAVSGAVYGVYATNFSDVLFASTLTVHDATNYAVVSTSGARVYVATISGSGNRVTFAGTLGGLCAFGVDASSVTGAQYFTDTGGRVYSGSQASVPSF